MGDYLETYGATKAITPTLINISEMTITGMGLTASDASLKIRCIYMMGPTSASGQGNMVAELTTNDEYGNNINTWTTAATFDTNATVTVSTASSTDVGTSSAWTLTSLLKLLTKLSQMEH